MFSNKSFGILGFTQRSIIHFKLIFIHRVNEVRVKVLFLYVDINFFQSLVENTSLSSLNYLGHFINNWWRFVTLYLYSVLTNIMLNERNQAQITHKLWIFVSVSISKISKTIVTYFRSTYLLLKTLKKSEKVVIIKARMALFRGEGREPSGELEIFRLLTRTALAWMLAEHL